jgi:hypothetical protein
MNSRSVYLIVAILIIWALIGLIVFSKQGTTNGHQINFNPQQMRVYKISDAQNTPLNILATTLPQFALKLADQKFKNLWEADASEKQSLVEGSATNLKGDVALKVVAKFDAAQKQLTVTPKTVNQLKPGLYKLIILIKNSTGQYSTITQDFTWGVLAIDTNKENYSVGEQVKIGMAILDDVGNTKCLASGNITFSTAKVWLTITSPKGSMQTLSTDDGKVSGSKECGVKTVTNVADFQAQIPAQEIGQYHIHLEAENINGKRSIDDSFRVQSTPVPFDVERSSYPTRIYPRADYPVSISVTANQDYSGLVADIVPSNFTISNISDSGKINDNRNFKTIEWQVDWKAGQTHQLVYTIKFPPVSPEFYLVGPLTISQFNEGREWQIASDSLFTLVQQADNTTSTTGATTVSATLGSAITKNDLLVLICYRTQNSSFKTPTSWATFTRNHNSSGPRIYMFYRIAPVGLSTTITCNVGTSVTSGNSMGIQVLEYSGNATSGVLDKAASVKSNQSCNSSPFTFATNTLKPTNNDELLISAFSATGNVSVSSHTNGFTDTIGSGFNATGTFDSGALEAIGSPTTSDTITYSAAAGNCDNLLVAFNSQLTISQGSFRFFDNANSATPGNPLAAQNTNLVLTSEHQPFRLRILLDTVSAGGTVLATASADFILRYAQLPADGNCSDGTFNDVLTKGSGTPIAYNTNSFSGGGSSFITALPISTTANDPSDTGYTTALEDYIDVGPNSTDNTNDITNNQRQLSNKLTGEWDLSLIDDSDNTSRIPYCLQITNADDSTFTLNQPMPEVTTAFIDVLINGGSTITGGTTIQ